MNSKKKERKLRCRRALHFYNGGTLVAFNYFHFFGWSSQRIGSMSETFCPFLHGRASFHYLHSVCASV